MSRSRRVTLLELGSPDRIHVRRGASPLRSQFGLISASGALETLPISVVATTSVSRFRSTLVFDNLCDVVGQWWRVSPFGFDVCGGWRSGRGTNSEGVALKRHENLDCGEVADVYRDGLGPLRSCHAIALRGSRYRQISRFV
jgi:hypothetical protein